MESQTNSQRHSSKSNISPIYTLQLKNPIEELSKIEEKTQLFKNLNIFVEIFNNNTNQSDCVIPILQQNGAIINSKIKKTTDYIIFKDGRKKLINPLWIHDCTMKGILLDSEAYKIKKTYTELLFENKKRKYNDIVLNTTKSMGTPGKRRKMQNNKIDKDFVSPSIIRKESKINSDILPAKFVKKQDNIIQKKALAEVKNGGNENVEIKERKDKLLITKENSNKKEKEDIYSVKNIHAEKSVFGDNIRCFNEAKNNQKDFPKDKKINHVYKSNNKENSNYSHSSVKIRERIYFKNSTPVSHKIKSLNINSLTLNTLDKSISKQDIIERNKSDPHTAQPVNKFLEDINSSILFENTRIKEKDSEVSDEINIKYKTDENKESPMIKIDEDDFFERKHDSNEIEKGIFSDLNNIPSNNLNKNNNLHANSKSINFKLTKSNSNLDFHSIKNMNCINLVDSNYSENPDVLTSKTKDNTTPINSKKFELTTSFKNDDYYKYKNLTFTSEKIFSFSSLNLNDSNKEKLKSILKNLNMSKITNGKLVSANRKDISRINQQSHIYLGDNFSDLNESEYIVVKNSTNTTNSHLIKEINFLYVSLLNYKIFLNSHDIKFSENEKKFIKFSYFTECEKKKKFLPLTENYIVKLSFDFLKIKQLETENNLPLKGFKIFLHPSIFLENNNHKSFSTENSSIKLNSQSLEFTSENYKQLTLIKIIQILGGDLVNHIRLCDLCIINKIELSQYFPPHVKNLHLNFIFDSLENLKLPEIENFKYKPKDGKYQRNRK